MCGVVVFGFILSRPHKLEREAQDLADRIASLAAQGKDRDIPVLVAAAEDRLGCDVGLAGTPYIEDARGIVDAAVAAKRAEWEYIGAEAIAEADVVPQKRTLWQDPKTGKPVPATRIRVAVVIGKCNA